MSFRSTVNTRLLAGTVRSMYMNPNLLSGFKGLEGLDIAVCPEIMKEGAGMAKYVLPVVGS